MHSTNLNAAFAVFFSAPLVLGSEAALAQPAPSPVAALVRFIVQDPRVPAEIRAEYRREDGDAVSCKLVDWLTAPDAPTPDPLRDVARNFGAACTLPVTDIDPAAAGASLGGAPLAAKVDGDVLTALARAPGPTPPQLCCSLHKAMERLDDSDVWALRFRLRHIDRAMLSFMPEGGGPISRRVEYRGPAAPPAPKIAARLKGRMSEDTLHSQALGETRRLHIYLPPGEAPPGGWPALFMADGSSAITAARIAEALVESGDMAPVALIGAESGQRGIVEDRSDLGLPDLRSADYLPDFPQAKDRFNQHLTFFTEELVAYAQAKYGVSADREKRAVTGFSNGGQLAFEAAVRRPEVFGWAIPRSAGWRTVSPDPDPSRPRARFLASAGEYEPGFLRTTGTSAEALAAAGYQVEFTAYAAGHMADQWDVALAKALPRIFPPR